jgi:hypothetical protein
VCFQLVKQGEIVQPILIAAGGGGSSSLFGGPSVSPDAQGLINPWESLNMWQELVSKQDTDAGKLKP